MVVTLNRLGLRASLQADESKSKNRAREWRREPEPKVTLDWSSVRNRNKQKSSKVMKMKMFATLGKTRPHTENTKGSNLAAVMCTTVQVSKTAVVD
jgi:hypothetical protein